VVLRRRTALRRPNGGAFSERLGLKSAGDSLTRRAYGVGGPEAGRLKSLIREADLLVNLGGVNYVLPERRGGRPAAYIDLDPVYTQIRLANGDGNLRTLLNAHTHLFTFGENIGTSRSSVPVSGYTWHHTPACSPDLWTHPGSRFGPPTIGTWNTQEWTSPTRAKPQGRKRTQWLRWLDLPARTAAAFEMAMDVGSVVGDGSCSPVRLAGHRSAMVSTDPRYRDYVIARRVYGGERHVPASPQWLV
jgi:hypothetical protein